MINEINGASICIQIFGRCFKDDLQDFFQSQCRIEQLPDLDKFKKSVGLFYASFSFETAYILPP